jgi:hypothetical protein
MPIPYVAALRVQETVNPNVPNHWLVGGLALVLLLLLIVALLIFGAGREHS